ncbi:MAG: tRNA (N6-threonylcarbamoyladenosine(37)-N6)-methyltransferase TrmO [Bdellovibrionaceae bacterium]|nr:tRNA (N6-threonylcarbamoyladenosine(37)-N6)-methyltransferase TrmO [Bdellovibrio sp.]
MPQPPPPLRVTSGVSNGTSFKSVLNLTPIGFFKSDQVEPYQAGRQPDSLGSYGRIMLEPGHNYEQALQDLEGCSHIWLIFGFHHNLNWKPLVQTPRSDRKIGVFATRAPYRPNQIGLSAVELLSIQGLMIRVAENDILDGTPIYDIKPYHAEHDSIPHAEIAWLKDSVVLQNAVTFSPVADTQLEFLEARGLKNLKSFILRQLEYDPTNKNKKRVAENTGYWTLAYRTWRIDFTYAETTIGVLQIYSGYTVEELKAGDDSYADKKLHQLFCSEFA